MALRDIQSFDTGATRDAGGFTSADGKWYGLLNHTADAAYTGGFGIRTNGGGETYTWGTNDQTVIFGFRHRDLPGIGDAFLRLLDSATAQVAIGSGSDGSVKAWRGTEAGTLLGTSAATGIIVTNTWHFIEIKVTISNTVGAIEVRVDGVTALTLSGIDTQATANAYVNQLQICGPDGVNSADFDDFYFCDDSGTLNNDFLGEGAVLLKLPSGAGTSTQWTPSAGSNFENVDDAAVHDSDTTYNETSTAGQKDLFAVGDVSVTGGSIAGVKLTTVMRKTDGGTREAAPIINLGGGESQRATETLSSSYVHYAEILEVDPVDAMMLTEAKVNAAEIGYTLVT